MHREGGCRHSAKKASLEGLHIAHDGQAQHRKRKGYWQISSCRSHAKRNRSERNRRDYLGGTSEKEVQLRVFNGALLEGSTTVLLWDTRYKVMTMEKETTKTRQAAVVLDHAECKVGQSAFNVGNKRDQLNSLFDIRIVRVGVPSGVKLSKEGVTVRIHSTSVSTMEMMKMGCHRPIGQWQVSREMCGIKVKEEAVSRGGDCEGRRSVLLANS